MIKKILSYFKKDTSAEDMWKTLSDTPDDKVLDKIVADIVNSGEVSDKNLDAFDQYIIAKVREIEREQRGQ